MISLQTALIACFLSLTTDIGLAETNPSDWKLSSSHNSNETHYAADGIESTRWTTRQPQTPGQSFTIDMIEPQLVNQVVLNSRRSNLDQPREYRLYASDDGLHWGRAISTGRGNPDGNTVIHFDALVTRYLQIVQTSRDDHYWWSIHEIDVQLLDSDDMATVPVTEVESSIEPRTTAKQQSARRWKPTKGWRDSYSVDGICYCDSSNYDHGIGSVMVPTPDGKQRSVVQICNDIKKVFGSGRRSDRIPYNTIACGNGPANDAADENLQTGCPGRVDIGPAGCFETGPQWPLEALYKPR